MRSIARWKPCSTSQFATHLPLPLLVHLPVHPLYFRSGTALPSQAAAREEGIAKVNSKLRRVIHVYLRNVLFVKE